jgi:hypothetical protein
MASFVKTNMKIRRMGNGRIRLCKRCGMAEAIFGDLCGNCHEYAERMKRRELARRGKLRAAGGLTGKPGPWPWPWLASECQKIISGRRDEK